VRKIQETRAEEVAGARDVAEALVEVQLWAPGMAELLRKTAERVVVVEDEDEAGVVVEVAEGVEEETELSRKDKDQRIRNLHHNPVVLAFLVVA
jgi:hypothetical protein